MMIGEKYVSIRPELRLHVRYLTGEKRPFVLLHGLASNAQTWNRVAHHLAAEGHPVYAVDQRGHGRSDKPDSGYDFATVSEDLALLLDQLELDSPIIAGQSWGGNVVLEFGARYPGRSAGLAFIDGGFLELQSRDRSSWEEVSQDLRPPDMDGMPAELLRTRILNANPEWTEEGVAATLENFERLPDGSLRRWLSIEKHMLILRALWEQKPSQLYGDVREPVLICPAASQDQPEWTAQKERQVNVAATALPHVCVHWFPNTHHDIHIHRPGALAETFLSAIQQGFWPS